MELSGHLWSQLKNVTADDLIAALVRDGWSEDARGGSQRIFRHPDGRRCSIHYHPQRTYGHGLLHALLDDIGWSEEDLRRLKLVR